jgi:hypothetical protein
VGGLAQTAQAAGLPGTTISHVTTTPFGWTARLLLRPGQTIGDAILQREALESALDARPRSVRLEGRPRPRTAGPAEGRSPRPSRRAVPWASPQAGSIRRPLQPGVWETGDPLAVSLANQHTLIVGATGSGKSMLLTSWSANGLADVGTRTDDLSKAGGGRADRAGVVQEPHDLEPEVARASHGPAQVAAFAAALTISMRLISAPEWRMERTIQR